MVSAHDREFSRFQEKVFSCEKCPRLRAYCKDIGATKRRAYLDQEYWQKPISGFGDLQARLMIVGLAPGAHGANRTGRVFTGDRSGEWLYRALHKAGFASQAQSYHQNDGLKLTDAYVSCVVKCAPPDNKPNREEQENCVSYLKKELEILSEARVWIALGHYALEGLWPLIAPNIRRPRFQHGTSIEFLKEKWLILSYHPSQQNTFTGRLTEPMFDSIFDLARKRLSP